jgi:hypothetical protein
MYNTAVLLEALCQHNYLLIHPDGGFSQNVVLFFYYNNSILWLRRYNYINNICSTILSPSEVTPYWSGEPALSRPGEFVALSFGLP